MQTVHLTLDGAWAECDDAACTLKFHIPDMSVADMEQVPFMVLLQLLEAADPAYRDCIDAHGEPYKIWGKADRRYNGGMKLHREYDLPAAVWYGTGHMEWYYNDRRHRENGKPAMIRPDGRVEYWVNDWQLDEHGNRI